MLSKAVALLSAMLAAFWVSYYSLTAGWGMQVKSWTVLAACFIGQFILTAVISALVKEGE